MGHKAEIKGRLAQHEADAVPQCEQPIEQGVRALPIWMLPVGDGAKRTVTVMAAEVANDSPHGKHCVRGQAGRITSAPAQCHLTPGP